MESENPCNLSSSGQELLLQELVRLAPTRRGVLGRDLTTFSIGGPLAILCEPESEEQLIAIEQLLRRSGVHWRILGAGSNILVDDAGVQDVVVRLGRGFRTSRVLADSAQVVTLEVGAAASVMTLSRTVSEQGLAGLEFAAGIPASVGGAVFMNAGAHGGDIASVLTSLTVLRGNGVERIQADALPFRYRHSGLEPESIVVSAVFTLRRGDREQIVQRRADCLAERKARQPLSSPSAGSVFRNPAPDAPAGRLIDESGLKGAVRGGALVSPLHGNWIINPDRSASSDDVRQLMSLCIETVAKRSGRLLEPEIIDWR